METEEFAMGLLCFFVWFVSFVFVWGFLWGGGGGGPVGGLVVFFWFWGLGSFWGGGWAGGGRVGGVGVGSLLSSFAFL